MAESMDACKEIFSIGLKDKREVNGWDKALMEMGKALEALKTTLSPNNTIEVIFKLLNMRDNMLKQFLRGVIYQKHLLWLDLKIPY